MQTPSDADPILDALRRALGSTLHVERELGGGGMSRVFVARDTALDRLVVVKTLPTEDAAPVDAARFAREVQLAARLQQANIVPLLTAGVAEGIRYYTMPLVEGEGVDARIAREGALPIGDVVNVARGVARALSYAHTQGIVHRDIKPANVLLSHGTAVVTDFGIAKAKHAISPGDTAPLTQVGAAIGTPAYMAPEQITGGDAVDVAADLYALGGLMYEMLTGHPPFERASPRMVLAAHLFDDPAPLHTDPRIPAPLAELVHELLAKEPTDRPESADAVLERLEAIVGASVSGSSAPPVELTPPKAAPRDGAPTESPARRHRRPALTIAAVAVVLGATLLAVWRPWSRPSGGPIRSIAVMPFEDISVDTEAAHMGHGVSSALVGSLSQEPHLSVVAPSPADLASTLGRGAKPLIRAMKVDALLTGSVQRQGDDLRVVVSLIDRQGTTIWGMTRARPIQELFKLEDELASAVTEAMGIARDVAPSPERQTSDVTAYHLYLEARQLVRQRGAQDLARAVARFRLAIDRDAQFAAAWVGLAESYILRALYSNVAAPEMFDSAQRAVDRALVLQPSAPDARTVEAYLHFLVRRDLRVADSLFRGIRRDAPEYVLAHKWHADVLDAIGDRRRAVDALRDAQQRDPTSAVIMANLAREMLAPESLAVRIATYDSALVLDPRLALALRDRALLAYSAHDSTTFFELHARWTAVSDRAGASPATLRETWRTGGSGSVTALQIASYTTADLPFERAWWRAQRGDVDGALDDLERAIDRGDAWVAFLGRFPSSAVRSSPRFPSLLRSAGLPPP